jgi:acyl-CoA-binding protein
MARPGILDLLGRAKWDSWNKQKGTEKVDAKNRYVCALIKVSPPLWMLADV